MSRRSEEEAVQSWFWAFEYSEVFRLVLSEGCLMLCK